MERLTKKGFNFTTNFVKRDIDSWSIAQCLKKLQEYEDLEEQGLLLRLPVAIGNIVYRINEYAEEPIIPMGVTSIQINGITNTFKEIKCKECVFGGEFTYRFSEFGRTVFLTKAEVEQKLKEMEND